MLSGVKPCVLALSDQKVPGKMSTFHIPFSHVRKCTGFMTSEVERPHKHSPQAVCVAFDEGAEMSTITIDAWERRRADWEQGYSLFAERKDVGPTLQCPSSITWCWSIHALAVPCTLCTAHWSMVPLPTLC